MPGVPDVDNIKKAFKGWLSSRKNKPAKKQDETSSAPIASSQPPQIPKPAEVSADSGLKPLALTSEPAPAVTPSDTTTSAPKPTNPDITITPSSATTEKPADHEVLPMTATPETKVAPEGSAGADKVTTTEASTTPDKPADSAATSSTPAPPAAAPASAAAAPSNPPKDGEMVATSGPLEDNPLL